MFYLLFVSSVLVSGGTTGHFCSGEKISISNGGVIGSFWLLYPVNSTSGATSASPNTASIPDDGKALKTVIRYVSQLLF
ncbi:hypothetical protein [Bacillus wiedmannii]|uniref:hypothetical protein n=1 Tax=Bacillus wiedmannii TaxID=1890302 RepID=UPI00211D6E88|nr:hypothetical protein [Bacillus wiedmannii]